MTDPKILLLDEPVAGMITTELEEMAQLVGSSRETVNKALMDFANRGWIAREGRSIIIYQPGMLIRRSRR